MYSTNRSSRGFDLGSDEALDGSPEVEEEPAHVEQVREALLKADGKLNAWEVDFCTSMLHIAWPSSRQLTILETLVAKAAAKSRSKRSKRTPARGRLF